MKREEIIQAFCKEIVDDSVLSDPGVTPYTMDSFGVQRNKAGYCGWVKCSNKVEILVQNEFDPIFCSNNCRVMFYNLFRNRNRKTLTPVGEIVEKFTDVQPPKHKCSCCHEEEEYYIPLSDELIEIQNWLMITPISYKAGLNQNQERFFDMCNIYLERIGISLKKVPKTVFYFANLGIEDFLIVENFAVKYKASLAFALFEIMTGTEMILEAKGVGLEEDVYYAMLDILYQLPDTIF